MAANASQQKLTDKTKMKNELQLLSVLSAAMIAITAGGLYNIFSGLLTAETHLLKIEICVIFTEASLISGVAVFLLSYVYLRYNLRWTSVDIFLTGLRTLFYTCYGYFILAQVFVGLIFLKSLLVVAIVLAVLPLGLHWIVPKVQMFIMEKSDQIAAEGPLP